MLDEVARRKGRSRLLLGVRVSHTIAGQPSEGDDLNCKDLGLDVETWVKKGYVDYVCPSYFLAYATPEYWPGIPNTQEFVELAEGANVGVYPTLWPVTPEIYKGYSTGIKPGEQERLLAYKNEICGNALRLYTDGADGISTFNWTHHHQPGMVHRPARAYYGVPVKKVEMIIMSKLDNPEALRQYLQHVAPLKP
jgi:hypothetical protein